MPKGVWQRLLACGSEQGMASFESGRVSRYEIASSLRLHALRCSKKGKAWYSREAYFEDFSCLSLLGREAEHLFSPLEDQGDLRMESEKIASERDDAWKSGYDAELSEGLSALIFHRLWRSVRDLFKKGIVFDGYVSWSNGRSGWDGSPLPFAWSDGRQTTFSPLPRLDEKLAFYCEGSAFRRRSLACSSGSMEPVPDYSELCEELLRLDKSPCVSMTPSNVDAVILSPNAAWELLAELLPCFRDDAASHLLFSQVFQKQEEPISAASGIRILCDALFPLFRHRHAPLDARGKRTQSVTLYEHGRPVQLVSSDAPPRLSQAVIANPVLERIRRDIRPNGHAVDPSGKTAIFYPVMLSTMSASLPPYDRALIGKTAERTLVVESLRMIRTGDSGGRAFLYVPAGGVLYVDGAAFGYVQPFRAEISLASLLRSLAVISSSEWCCGAGVCALSLEPSHLFERLFL